MSKRTGFGKFWLAAVIMTMMVMLGIGCSTVFAYGITQTSCETNSATITWTKPSISSSSTLVDYKVYKKTYAGSDEYQLLQTLSPSQTQYTFTGLQAGTKYNVKVTYDYKNSSGKTSELTVGSDTIKSMVSTVTGLRQEKWWYFALALDVEWDPQDAADGYEFECYKSNGKLQAKETINGGYSHGTSVRKIKNEMIYTCRVRPFMTVGGAKRYAEWTAPIYCFTQPRITKAKVSGNKLNISWKKVDGATGYAVYASTKPKTGYKLVKKVGKNKSSVTTQKVAKKKVNKKKTYYVYVVTLKKVNGKTNDSGRLYYWNTKNSSFGYF